MLLLNYHPKRHLSTQKEQKPQLLPPPLNYILKYFLGYKHFCSKHKVVPLNHS